MNPTGNIQRWSPSRLSQRAQAGLVVGLALLLVVTYSGVGALSTGGGFPLDDSWIHQTYARNLAMKGLWEYGPGQISAGSTSPLWTLLLALGYFFHVPYLVWTTALGGLALAWLGWSVMVLWKRLWPELAGRAWVAGVVAVTSWQLVWAGASGMETLLFIALILQILAIYLGSYHWNARSSLALGLVGGLSVLARPEGVALLTLAALGIFVRGMEPQRSVRNFIVLAIGAAAIAIPYFAFNLLAGGHVWPNTFYSKQAEYALEWERALPYRFLRLLYFSMGGPDQGWRGISGAHWLLIPGVVDAAVQAVRCDWSDRRWQHTLPLVWALSHVFLYAWRLPVTYQHGRYLWPVLPVYLIFGLAGWAEIGDRLKHEFNQRVRFVGRSISRLTFGVLVAIFLLLGLGAYIEDVALIEGEMVEVALWLRENTLPTSLIATHDIGAIGYFSERPLVDLAGLVSPEVVPFLSDEEAMAEYIMEQGAAYLVTAPGWRYSTIIDEQEATRVFVSDYEPTRLAGSNNMAVFKLDE